MSSFTYQLCERKIKNKRYDSVEEMREMIDVFFAVGRFDAEAYATLNDLIEQNEAEKEDPKAKK